MARRLTLTFDNGARHPRAECVLPPMLMISLGMAGAVVP